MNTKASNNAAPDPAVEQSRTASIGATETKWVDAVGLLEALFDERSRPSPRWVRQHQGRVFPCKKLGRRILFDVQEVRRAIDQRRTVGLCRTR